MGELSKLTGTPWHVGKYTREEGDPRRHRSRCIYYQHDKSFCAHLLRKCCGSAHCDYYEEQEKAGAGFPASAKSTPQYDSVLSASYPIGSKVEHKTYGRGSVVGLEDGIIKIAFKDGHVRKFVLNACIQNNLLKKI